MGDYASPKSRDLCDRLYRRFEQYRRRHGNVAVRYDRLTPAVYEHQRQETLLLHQRWLESKAKKAAKTSKSSNNSNAISANANSGSRSADALNQNDRTVAQVAKKRKIEHEQGANSCNIVDSIYNFEENEEQQRQNNNCGNSNGSNNKKADHDNCLRSQVSVNIIQQINTQGDHNQTSKIKLTVSSTVHTGNNNNTSTESNISQTSTIDCKQEPQDSKSSSQSDTPINTSNSQSSFADNIIGVDDELEAFLNQLSPDVFQDLMDNAGPLSQEGPDTKDIVSPDINKFTEPTTTTTVVQVAQHQQVTIATNSSNISAGDIKKNANRERKNSHPSTPGGMYHDPLNSASSPSAQPYVSMGGPNTMPMQGYPRPQSGPPIPGASPGVGSVPTMLGGDTGPAAETLRQMARQHRPEFDNMKGSNLPSHLSDSLLDYPRGPSNFNPYMYLNNGQQGPGMYSYGSQNGNGPIPNMVRTDPSQSPSFTGQNIPKMEPGMSSGSTKPLSHFPDSAPSSSLQQLQNQVHSQFSQAGGSTSHNSYGSDSTQLHIKQSQHMQMTTGNNSAPPQSVNMSQSQQLQIHAGGPSPHHISMAQQQSFSMSQASNMRSQPHTGGPYMSQQQPSGPHEDMKMPPGGMYTNDKMVPNPAMRQYMDGAPSHPPPEYKPPPGGAGFSASNGPNMRDSGNPLQTMQNMVNQTPHSLSTTPNAVSRDMIYQQRMIKTEMVTGPNGQMVTGPNGQMMPHPQMMQMGQSGDGSGPNSGRPDGVMGGPRPAPPYPQHNMTHPSMANGTGPTKSGKQDNSVYTSAIMRGQRPPNVNVGPDGLNISHQRNPADWPRPMMSPHPGMNIPGHSYPGAMRPGIPQGMMSYSGGYPGGAYHQGMNMEQQHHIQMSQQQAMAYHHQQRMQHPQQRQMMPMGGNMMGPRMGQHPQMSPGSGPMPPGMHMAQHQQMSLHHNGQAMSMNHSGPMVSTTSHHNMAPSQHPAQVQPYPNPRPPSSQGMQMHPQSHPPSQGHPNQQNPQMRNPSGPEFALDFLDHPSSGNTDFFDSVVQNTNPSDFNNFIDDILGGGK